jgi:iron complex outermembrane receptor protein
MKKFIGLFMCLVMTTMTYADTIESTDSVINQTLDEFTVTSFYRSATPMLGSSVDSKNLVANNYGQEPSWLFAKMPSIFAFSDNGTDFGYGYFRIRGLDQTRINVTLDGMPWNEAEDFGCYFANSPDIMADAGTIDVGRGTSTYNPGTASYGGSINISSVDLLKNTTSYAEFGAGSFASAKTSVNINTGLMGKWALHVRGTLSHTDGYREHSQNNSQSLGFKLGYFINEKSWVDLLSITGYHTNGQGYIGVSMEDLEKNRHLNGCSKDEDDNFFQTVNKLTYNSWLGEKILFTSSLYWNMLMGEYRFDLDNYMIRLCDEPMETGMLYNYGLKQHMYGGNAAARYYINDGSITIGTNIYKFEREHYLDDRNIDKARNIDPAEYYGNRGHKMDYEVFLNAKKSFGNFTLSANAQYRGVNFWYRDLMNPLVEFDEDTKWNFLNFGADVSYKIGRHNEVYLKYARANREPTRTDMFGGNEWYPGALTTTDAEVSNDVEIGWNIATKRLNANLNLFGMFFENERSLTGTIGLNGLPEHEKADNSHRMGIELYVDYNPFAKLHLINNSSYSNNKVKTDTYGTKTHVLTPGCTFNQDIEWRDKIWTFGIGYKYRSHMYLDMANTERIPDLWQLNLYGSVTLGKFIVSGHVNNITNRDNMQTGVLTNTNKARFMPDAPTNVFTSIKYMF